MTSRMTQFEHIVATELPIVADDFELGEDDRETLDAWVTSLQDWMAGILDWHHITGRYDEAELLRLNTLGTVIAGGEPAVTGSWAASKPFASGSQGLGTAALRLAATLARQSGPVRPTR